MHLLPREPGKNLATYVCNVRSLRIGVLRVLSCGYLQVFSMRSRIVQALRPMRDQSRTHIWRADFLFLIPFLLHNAPANIDPRRPLSTSQDDQSRLCKCWGRRRKATLGSAALVRRTAGDPGPSPAHRGRQTHSLAPQPPTRNSDLCYAVPSDRPGQCCIRTLLPGSRRSRAELASYLVVAIYYAQGLLCHYYLHRPSRRMAKLLAREA